MDHFISINFKSSKIKLKKDNIDKTDILNFLPKTRIDFILKVGVCIKRCEERNKKKGNKKRGTCKLREKKSAKNRI